jgi:hypothetical protein
MAEHNTEMGLHLKFRDAVKLVGQYHQRGDKITVIINCFDNLNQVKFSTDNKSYAICWRLYN